MTKIAKVNRVKSETLRELAYKELRGALLAGHFSPGEQISIRELSEQMGLGVMPVREGVQQLASQGTLEFLPNRSVRVPVHTTSELRQIFAARALLECHAVARAAENISEKELARLSKIMERMFLQKLTMPIKDIVAANYDFHFGIYRHCESPYIVEMIEGLWLRISPLHIDIFKAAKKDQTDFFSVYPLHMKLLAALGAREGEKASAIMKSLLDKSLEWHCTHMAEEEMSKVQPKTRGRRPKNLSISADQ